MINLCCNVASSPTVDIKCTCGIAFQATHHLISQSWVTTLPADYWQDDY